MVSHCHVCSILDGHLQERVMFSSVEYAQYTCSHVLSLCWITCRFDQGVVLALLSVVDKTYARVFIFYKHTVIYKPMYVNI